jgi:succinate dehydrogenase/fumarate reductase flavoprotein subunit
MGEAFDVVVVGFGLAGAIAAIEAHDSGAKVLLLEKEPVPGGISICAGGGLRTADSADKALAYLKATCAETTPEPVLAAFARGTVELPKYVGELADAFGAKLKIDPTAGNYPLPGYETWSYIEIDHVPGFDPAITYPHARSEGVVNGRNMFRLVHEHVLRRGIEVRVGSAVHRLWRQDDEVRGVICGDTILVAQRAVVLACGGFEASEELQCQFWPTTMRPASTLANTGDGIRMAQEAGAGLWHMWHSHGVYGFHHPDSDYKLGIRVRRMRNWTPGTAPDRVSRMSWIIVNQRGERFMNEYDPYMQDTNHRPLALYDPTTQCCPAIPSVLVVDAQGRDLHTLCEPAYNNASIAARFNKHTVRDFDDQILVTRPSLKEIAKEFDLDSDTFTATIAEWNAACDAGADRAFGRPPRSMMPIAQPPFSAAAVWPIVSNTQGGLPHDEDQRVLDAFGRPIRRLYVAGELGSVFGHLYLSGGNYSECLIGGRIAGVKASQLEPWSLACSA